MLLINYFPVVAVVAVCVSSTFLPMAFNMVLVFWELFLVVLGDDLHVLGDSFS